MKITRKIIEIDEAKCNGCGLCANACAEGAIEIVDGKARIVKETYCDGLGACIGECPEGALTIVEREADAFDATAVEEHLKGGKVEKVPEEKVLACGCPSSHVQILAATPGPAAPGCGNAGPTPSALSHWPVQIRLVPPTAPFLKGRSLLVAADCTPVACPDFHRDFLKDRAVLIGCPKFDDTDEYVAKFRDIFLTAGVKGRHRPHHGSPLLLPPPHDREGGPQAVGKEGSRRGGGNQRKGRSEKPGSSRGIDLRRGRRSPPDSTGCLRRGSGCS